MSRTHRLLNIISIAKSHSLVPMKQRSHSEAKLQFSAESAVAGSIGAFFSSSRWRSSGKLGSLNHCNVCRTKKVRKNTRERTDEPAGHTDSARGKGSMSARNREWSSQVWVALPITLPAQQHTLHGMTPHRISTYQTFCLNEKVHGFGCKGSTHFCDLRSKR